MNVLVTGAGKGVGFELVQSFAKDKENKVVAISRNLDSLKSLQSLCDEKFENLIHIYSIDFLSDNLEEELVNFLSELNYHFDVVVNNAGYLVNKPFEDMDQREIFDLFQVNLFAPMLLIKSIIPYLDKNLLSHIVNIGSMGGYQGSSKFPGLSVYSSSKSALANLTECLAEEFKDRGVVFNCLALGSVQTEMLSAAFPGFVGQVSAVEMAKYIYDFSIQSPVYMNGKVIPVSSSTP